jgi:hypothetical protein
LVRVNETPTTDQKAAIRAKAGLDWDRLVEAQKYCASFDGPNSLLVIRHGWIAGEWNNMSAPRGIASCTKSLTALAMAKLFDLNDAGRLTNSITIETSVALSSCAMGRNGACTQTNPAPTSAHMTSGLTPYDGPCPTNTYRDVIAQTVEAARQGLGLRERAGGMQASSSKVTRRAEDEFSASRVISAARR